MTTWFTSDLHFGHEKIAQYTGRPYDSVPEMNDDIVVRWNSHTKPEDTVYVLGDVCMGKLDESLLYISQLNGRKILVPGNHDRMFDAKGAKHERAIQRYLDAGFDEIVSYHSPLFIAISSPEIALVVQAHHLPYNGDSGENDDRYEAFRPTPHPESAGRLLHGHTHGRWRKKGDMIDVGVDAWGGYPVSERELVDLFENCGNLDPYPWVSEREDA